MNEPNRGILDRLRNGGSFSDFPLRALPAPPRTEATEPQHVPQQRSDPGGRIVITKFLVRRASGFAQKFVRNLCGTHATGVADHDASTFEQRWQAELKIAEAGLPADECTVEEIDVTED